MEPASPSGDGVFHAAIAVAGALCALGMCVGALGPWARTPVISFSGWAGIGFPLVILAFVILAIQVLHGFVPRRAWLVLNLLLGAFTLVCAIVLALLESVLSRVGSLVAFIFARGTHRDLLGSGHPLTLAWGIPVLGVMSFLLMLVCVAGLFGSFGGSLLPSALRRSSPATSPDGSPLAAPARGIRARLRSELSEEVSGSEASSALESPSVPFDDLL